MGITEGKRVQPEMEQPMTPKERAAMQQALEALEMLKSCKSNPLWCDEATEAITALREVLAEQAEQEPVCIGWDGKTDEPIMGYAAPVRTKDLTDDEIVVLIKQFKFVGMTDRNMDFARAVIAADREKNKCQH